VQLAPPQRRSACDGPLPGLRNKKAALVSPVGIFRLFLAWVVAAAHWRIDALISKPIPFDDHYLLGFNAGYAVMFFYVISGFLITYTLTRNYERNLAGTLKFYQNRFIRIFSLYWPLVLIAFFTVDLSWQTFLSAAPIDKVISLFLLGMDWRIAFASAFNSPAYAAIHGLEQAWTLGAELTFYLMAPLLLRSWKIGAVLMAMSLATRMAFVVTLGAGHNPIWTYTFFPSTLCFFLFGHLMCVASQRWDVLRRPLFGAMFLVCSIVAMTFGSYRGFDSPRFWLSILCFTISLPALFEATKKIGWMNALGNLSYPVYLVHYGILLTIGPWLIEVALPLDVMPATEAGWVSIAAFLAVTTAVALVVHKWIEVPVAYTMHRLADGLPWAKLAKAEAD
jgi:peptidoglycan/LPS O-acetylase OafA/YrhL